MRGTFQYCKTKEAIKRMEDGDMIQNCKTEQYFKMENNIIYASTNTINWGEFVPPMTTFPPYEEWRSCSNLHYYKDLKKQAGNKKIWYLTNDEQVIDETDSRADKNKKRWFFGSLLE